MFFLPFKFACTSSIWIIFLYLEYNVFFIVLRCHQCVVSVCNPKKISNNLQVGGPPIRPINDQRSFPATLCIFLQWLASSCYAFLRRSAAVIFQFESPITNNILVKIKILTFKIMDHDRNQALTITSPVSKLCNNILVRLVIMRFQMPEHRLDTAVLQQFDSVQEHDQALLTTFESWMSISNIFWLMVHDFQPKFNPGWGSWSSKGRIMTTFMIAIAR